MKTIIFLLFITLSFAFVAERSFLETKTQETISTTPTNPEIIQETNIEEPIREAPRLQRQNAMLFTSSSDSEDSSDLETSNSDSFQVDQTYFHGLNSSFTDLSNIEEPIREAPRLQRQNAIRFPLSSDFEDSSDLETSDSDSFQVDQTYFYGLNSSFTDLYNEWNKEDLANQTEDTEAETVKEEVVDDNFIQENFGKVENVFEDIFDELMVSLKRLSNEAEESKTILGMDKSSFKGALDSVRGDFGKMFNQVFDELNVDQTVPGLDKESVKEYFDELEDKADEVFDQTLLTLKELAKESNEKNTFFGFGKENIKEFFDQAEQNFGKILNMISFEIIELSDQDLMTEDSSDSDLSTDVKNIDSNESNSTTDQTLEVIEVDLDEVLLAIRGLFDDAVEEKALFGSDSKSEDIDTFEVDNTYFNGLGSELNQDSVNKVEYNAEVNFEKLFAALSGLVKEAVEAEIPLQSEQSDK